MGSPKHYAATAGCFALLMAAASAQAADLLGPPPPMPEPYLADVGGGWYLRGDVGVSHYEASKVSHPTRRDIQIYDRDFGDGAFAGAGIGYQFNSWFRADVTGEYRFSTGMSWRDKGRFNEPYTTMGRNGLGQIDFINGRASGTSFEKTKTGHSAAVVMLNGYFDLGTWYGLTPFVGAGVGYAHHFLRGGQTDTVNNYDTFTPNGGVAGPGNFIPNGVAGGRLINKDQGNLAWALHAGIGYDVSQNLKLEVAYRYLNMGSIKTGGIDCFCTAPIGEGFKVKNLESHDIKIGMRWMLGGPAAVAYEPAPAPGPIIRKY